MGWNDKVIDQYRAGHQRIVDTFDQDELLLLHTTGAKSGQPRLSPVAYLDQGDRLLIVASAAGADRHPAWSHNLLANPVAQVERWVDGVMQTEAVVAEFPDDDERDRLWSVVTEWAPGFARYQEKTERVIPVIVLRPRG